MNSVSKKNALIIFGGVSPEHEVSCSSAAGIVDAVDREQYNVFTIGITKEGAWIYKTAPAEAIADSTSWLKDQNNRKAFISPDHRDHGIYIFEKDGTVRTERIDVVFPIIHGENGEDGTLQGLFEIAGIPYVGSGVCASACSMDKVVTRTFADNAKLLQPGCYIVDPEQWSRDSEAVLNEIEAYFGGIYPVITKPAMTGSSVGISKVENRGELYDAIQLAAGYKGYTMIEQFIAGREIKVAVLEDGEVKTGAICEIRVQEGCFNDYNTKYKSAGTHKKIPADLTEQTEREIREASVRIFKELGCKDYARVDFFVTDDDTVYFNEINTIPGFTAHSIFPLMFEKVGLPYAEMVNRMLANALDRAE